VVDSHRAYLGIAAGEATNGVYVASVTANGPAANAGIHAADVIVSVDGKPTSTKALLTTVLAGLKPGQKVQVAFNRQIGAATTRLVTLGTYPGR
jgi:S1-C subfamily serine protease